jgi:hypothetical protein
MVPEGLEGKRCRESRAPSPLEEVIEGIRHVDAATDRLRLCPSGARHPKKNIEWR